MYTGIVDHLGEVIAIHPIDHGLHLTIRCDFENIKEGESICIDGMCVTAINPQKKQFECDLSPNTLQLTIAKYYKVGQAINLERSMQAGDRFGGHFVMGHVETTATVASLENHGDFTQIRIRGLSTEGMRYIIKKGSVSVNGISLTINAVGKNYFDLMIIPHTKQRTNVQFWQVGDRVNIEYDTIARVIADRLQAYEENLK